MIRTDISIKDTVLALVQGSPLAGMVSGEVYKDRRPLNSDKEDIVIAVIGSSGNEVQRATVNVNVYVRDLLRGQDPVEDGLRLDELGTAAAELLEYRHLGDVIVELESQKVEKVNGIDWHLINNRLRIRFSNE